jgi:quercetin dioxygenase-like cupin family protein
MLNAGEVIENPATGDKVKFLQTAKETNGELLQFEEWMKVGGTGPIEHFHPRQDETFKVVKGTMGVLLDGNVVILHEGEQITVRRGRRHRWWNAGAEELDHISEFRPALQFDAFMATIFALGREKHVYGGLPLALQFAVLNQKCKDVVWLAKPAMPIQRVLFPVLAFIGSKLGYEERFHRTSRY